jgi:hypothetical protein
LLASIWRQLVYRRPIPTQDVLDIYFANVEKGTRPGIDEISRALENEISRYNKAFIVIDAADECSKGTLTTVLRYLNKPTISLMVTSRFSAIGVLAGFGKLQIQANPIDIELYISHRIDSSPILCRHFGKDESLRQDVISMILQRAAGM